MPNKIMHNRKVIEANYENTGGSCITYYGKFDTGEYFAFGLGTFGIYDADYGITFTQEFFEETDGDTSEWENEHVIEIFDEDEVLDYVNQTHYVLCNEEYEE